MSKSCPFCPDSARYYLENELAGAILDHYPVNPGHTLVVPKAHRRHLFECTRDDLAAMWEVLEQVKQQLDQQYHPDGYNVGANVEACGGQTVFHCHIHVIPRFQGDTPNPRGGVRRVKHPLVAYGDMEANAAPATAGGSGLAGELARALAPVARLQMARARERMAYGRSRVVLARIRLVETLRRLAGR